MLPLLPPRITFLGFRSRVGLLAFVTLVASGVVFYFTILSHHSSVCSRRRNIVTSSGRLYTRWSVAVTTICHARVLWASFQERPPVRAASSNECTIESS